MSESDNIILALFTAFLFGGATQAMISSWIMAVNKMKRYIEVISVNILTFAGVSFTTLGIVLWVIFAH